MTPYDKVTQSEPDNISEVMSQETSKSVQFELDDKSWEILEPSSFEKLVSDDELFSRSDVKGQQNLNLKSSEDFENNLPLNGDISSNLDYDSDIYNSEDYSDVEYFDEELRNFDAFPQIKRNTKKYKSDIKHSTTNIISPKNIADQHMKSFIEILNNLSYNIKAGGVIKQQTQLRKHPLAKYVLDRKTCKIIHEFFNKKYIMKITGVLEIENDYVTLHAYGTYIDYYQKKKKEREYVLKIYKPSVSQFLNIENDTKHKKTDIKLARECAQKQACELAEKGTPTMRNLNYSVIPYADTAIRIDHVLFLDFIGKYEKPASNLMEANMSVTDYISAYNQIITIMKTLYRNHGKVHKDLTEYNIYWHEEKCFIIDWDSVKYISCTENANEVVMKSCKNFSEFFTRKQVPGVLPSAILFQKIVGRSYKQIMKSK